jgi:hypothetical protein
MLRIGMSLRAKGNLGTVKRIEFCEIVFAGIYSWSGCFTELRVIVPMDWFIKISTKAGYNLRPKHIFDLSMDLVEMFEKEYPGAYQLKKTIFLKKVLIRDATSIYFNWRKEQRDKDLTDEVLAEELRHKRRLNSIQEEILKERYK